MSPRYTDPMSFVCTPGYLINAGLVLNTWCPTCLKFGRTIGGAELAEKYGPDADVHEIAKRMVCAAGHRGAEISTVPRAAFSHGR